MRRVCFVLFAILMGTLAAPAQTDPSDSQTLKSLLAEVRLLRRDFHTSSALMERAQILLHRMGALQTAVDHATERRDAAQYQLLEAEHNREGSESAIAEASHAAPMSDVSQNTNADGLDNFRLPLEQLRNQLAFWMQRESEDQNELNEAEEQLRVEQGKLAELQAELDRIDQAMAEVRAD